MTTSSPTTADIKAMVEDQIARLLAARLSEAEYAEYCTFMSVLNGLRYVESMLYRKEVASETTHVPTTTTPLTDHVKTYGGTPTARERIRAYLKEHGPNRVVDILRGTGVKRGTISGILLGRDFVKVKHGVWNLRPGK